MSSTAIIRRIRGELKRKKEISSRIRIGEIRRRPSRSKHKIGHTHPLCWCLPLMGSERRAPTINEHQLSIERRIIYQYLLITIIDRSIQGNVTIIKQEEPSSPLGFGMSISAPKAKLNTLFETGSSRLPVGPPTSCETGKDCHSAEDSLERYLLLKAPNPWWPAQLLSLNFPAP